MNLRKDHQCVCVRCSIYTLLLSCYSFFSVDQFYLPVKRNHACCVLTGLSGVFVCLFVVITTTTTNECNI